MNFLDLCRAFRRIAGIGLALALAATIPQGPAHAQQDTAVLHAQFKLEDGYFVIDEAASTFEDSTRGKFRGVPNAKAEIIKVINRSVKGDVEAIFHNLDSNEIGTLRRSRHIDTEDNETVVDRGLLQASELMRSDQADLAKLSSSWHDLSGIGEDKRHFILTSFGRFLLEERGVCWVNRSTPILYREPPDAVFDPSAAVIWQDKLEHGRFDFAIADPLEADDADSIELGADETERAAFARAGITQRKIRQLLARLAGRLWSRPVIAREINDYLMQAGISGARIKRKPSVGCTFAGAARIVEISNGPARLRRIVIQKDQADQATAAKLLSRVLPHRDFAYFHAHPDMLTSDEQTISTDHPEKVWVFDLASPQGRQLPVSGPHGFLTTDRTFDDLRARIGILGHQASSLPTGAPSPQSEGLNPVPMADAVTPSDGTLERWVWLKVIPVESTGDQAAPPSRQEEAQSGPPDPSAGSPPAPAPAPAPAATKPPQETPVSPRSRNRVRVTAGNEPGQPFFAGIDYSRDALTGDDDGLTLNVSTRGKPSFKGSYERDFLAFDAMGGRRLSLTISGESAYLPNHVVGAATVDERRSGGSVAAQLELFRDWNGHWLNLDASFSYHDLDQHDQSSLTTRHGWLSKGRIGLGYRWLKDQNPEIPRLEINPSIDIGRSNDGGTYLKPATDARFHTYLPAFFEFDLHLAAAWSSPRTPGTELPRFGGSDSVRGFKDEIAAARSSWAVQSEVYVPIRFLERIAPDVDEFVRRNLKLAGFVDIGGAGRNSQGISGFEAGAGLGIRLILKDQAVVRLDWAHPLTDYQKRQGGSAIYFSIVILPQHF